MPHTNERDDMTTETENPSQDERLMVTLRVPVTYQMYGYAAVQVPIGASEDDILEAIDDLQPRDLKDTDLMVRGNGGPDVETCRHCRDDAWKVHLPDHLEMLSFISAAFESLEAKHVLTFAHQCCTSDSAGYGHDALEEKPEYIGFAYFHEQNMENILDEGLCHIGFCSREDTPESHQALANLVCEALREQGLTATWDGSINSKIEVSE